MLCRLRLDQNNELRRLEMSSRAKDKLLEYHRICPFLSPVIPSAEGEQYVLDLKYEVGKGNLRQRIKNLNRRQISFKTNIKFEC
ncbi:hypothetical protein MHBO_000354 [Bonamia ostreae]|uniref:Uncharacterized protein n=1 Tax=Bonamia ostreae TaxID=126728 RepID=A0ABV2AG71_9EUKA